MHFQKEPPKPEVKKESDSESVKDAWDAESSEEEPEPEPTPELPATPGKEAKQESPKLKEEVN